jgi:hypothetical protein
LTFSRHRSSTGGDDGESLLSAAENARSARRDEMRVLAGDEIG